MNFIITFDRLPPTNPSHRPHGYITTVLESIEQNPQGTGAFAAAILRGTFFSGRLRVYFDLTLI